MGLFFEQPFNRTFSQTGWGGGGLEKVDETEVGLDGDKDDMRDVFTLYTLFWQWAKELVVDKKRNWHFMVLLIPDRNFAD